MKIVICVSGGVVTDVFSSVAGLDVVVRDHDTEGHDEEDVISSLDGEDYVELSVPVTLGLPPGAAE